MEFKRLPALSKIQATTPLIAVAKKESIKPNSTLSKGWGSNNLPQAAIAILRAAIRIKALSNPLEKYSALP